MTLTIYALDNQFAAATDGNVNNGPGTSTFDYPPNSTSNLVIESQPGDDTPYIFSPGDTYTLTFQGNGGTTIQNAVVIRSDPISLDGDDGWAVVFEGLDPQGDVVQVVWTPEFDMETWYWNNFSGGNPPGFYTTDANAASYAAPCFAPETPVETEDGPCPAGEIVAGMRLMTRDRGLQPVVWVARTNVIGRSRAAPVWFAPDVLGNTAPFALSQQHRVLLSGLEVRAAHGVEEVLAPALCLLNGATLRLAPRGRIGYVHLLMERHEVLIAAGAPVESLHLGPEARLLLARVETPPPARLLARPARPARKLLTRREGEALWAAIRGANGAKPAMLGRRGTGKGARAQGVFILPLGQRGKLPPYLRIEGAEDYADLMAGAKPSVDA